jgi:hypothetical protein
VKRLIPLLAITLCIAATPVFALDNNAPRDDRASSRDRTTMIDDIVRMSQSGVSDDSIIRFIRTSRERYVMNADTIIQLTDAKVSKPVIDALLDYSDNRGNDGRYNSSGSRTTVFVSPAPYYGYGYYSPYWYDPFWYGPRIGFSIGFGRGWGGGHYYGGGGFRHGRR